MFTFIHHATCRLAKLLALTLERSATFIRLFSNSMAYFLPSARREEKAENGADPHTQQQITSFIFYVAFTSWFFIELPSPLDSLEAKHED